MARVVLAMMRIVDRATYLSSTGCIVPASLFCVRAALHYSHGEEQSKSRADGLLLVSGGGK